MILTNIGWHPVLCWTHCNKRGIPRRYTKSRRRRFQYSWSIRHFYGFGIGWCRCGQCYWKTSLCRQNEPWRSVWRFQSSILDRTRMATAHLQNNIGRFEKIWWNWAQPGVKIYKINGNFSNNRVVWLVLYFVKPLPYQGLGLRVLKF